MKLFSLVVSYFHSQSISLKPFSDPYFASLSCGRSYFKFTAKMIQVDIEANRVVRQRFEINCLLLKNRISALQLRNQQISLRLQALITKNKVIQASQVLALVNSQIIIL